MVLSKFKRAATETATLVAGGYYLYHYGPLLRDWAKEVIVSKKQPHEELGSTAVQNEVQLVPIETPDTNPEQQ